jgi:hypothetical protein
MTNVENVKKVDRTEQNRTEQNRIYIGSYMAKAAIFVA